MGLETERLYFKQLTMRNFEDMKNILSDERTVKNFHEPYDDEGVRRWIRWCRDCYDAWIFGLYGVFLKETNEFLGDCGIIYEKIDGEGGYQICYHFNREYWNKGYATEAALFMQKYFFNNTYKEDLYAHINVNHIPAHKVAEHLGMTKVGEYTSKHGYLKDIYRITRMEYLEKIRVTLNPDTIIVDRLKEAMRINGGYCPCKRIHDEDTKCMCKEFRNQIADPNFEGFCHCMLYYKAK